MRTPDGRDLEVVVSGPEAGDVLVFHHGSPGAALLPPGEIDVPVAVWHGKQDRAVPFAHGRWLCDHLAQSRDYLTEEDGHLSPITRPDLLLDELL